jgi:hypothetical protein
MKKSITTLVASLAVFSLAMNFSITAQPVQAQTVNCPAGFTCTPVASQPTGCPTGYTCTPATVNTSPVNTGTAGTQICPSFSTYLGIGSSGSDVATLQSFLITNGFDIPSVSASRTQKGYFGPQTAKALSQYQGRLGLPVTGVLDVATQAQINSGGCMQYKLPVSYNQSNPNMAGGLCPAGQSWIDSSCEPASYNGSNPNMAGGLCPTGQVWKGSGCVLPAQPQSQSSIKVISPNGGQTFNRGQSTMIQWSTQNVPSNATMNINLANENGVVGQLVTGLNPNTIQSYTWNTASPIGTISTISGLVPEYIYPGQYKIDLEVYIPVPVTDANQKGMITVADLSDNYFTVTDSSGNLPVAPSINAVNPTSIPNDGITTAVVSGSGFNSSSAVYFSGPVYRYAYKTIPSSVSASSLTFAIAQNFPPAGQYQLTVSNDGIAMSNPLNVTVTATSPTTAPTPIPVIPVPSDSIITSIVGPNGGFWANNSAGIWTVYISDPNSSSISVTADWGDGSPSGSGNVNGSNGSVQVGHQYKASGTYTITFTARDSNGLTAQKTLTQQVW